jgi:23S rRNA (adenine2503-C2)-methyltransferase
MLFAESVYMKIKLLGKNLDELKKVVAEEGLPGFTAKQIAQWLYVKKVRSIDEMTNLSKVARARLSEKYEVGVTPYAGLQISSDGTKKYLFRIAGEEASHEARYIESVYIPDNDRATLCVSTQAGCKMGCKFCMTGTLGFHGHLSAGEILNQIFSIPDADKLTNLVYMGEGEPMDNLEQVMRSLEVMTSSWGCAWSPKRITVSTVGVLPKLKTFIEKSECHLAVSLHNPFAIERQQIMPIEKVHHINQVIALLKEYDWSHQRRVSFEYICWGGMNDSIKHANELVRMLKGLDCRINLIRFHASHAESKQERKEGHIDWTSSNEQQMEWMRDYLTDKGITTTIRRSRGEDILAACGMLVNALKK